MKLLRYPDGTFSGDCRRGLAGLLLVALLAGLGAPGVFGRLILVSLAGLFLVFLYRAWRRVRGVYKLNEERLARTSDDRYIVWSSLSDLTLAYYTTRQDRQEGWFELKLVAATGVMTVDSRLRGFDALLQRALRAARDNDLNLSPATCNNAGSFHGFPDNAAGPGARPWITNA